MVSDGEINVYDNIFYKKIKQDCNLFFNKSKKLENFSYLELENIVNNFIFNLDLKLKKN